MKELDWYSERLRSGRSVHAQASVEEVIAVKADRRPLILMGRFPSPFGRDSTNRANDHDPVSVGTDPFVERAARLFEFLARVQQLKERPVRHVDSYKRDEGAVLWFDQIPQHDAIEPVGRDPQLEDPALVLDRLPRRDPPGVPGELRPWVAGRLDDADGEPTLKDRTVVETADEKDNQDGEGGLPSTVVLVLGDHPQIRKDFARWIEDWRAWAAEERSSRTAREFYNELFRIHTAQRNANEDWEVILGVGALSWAPPGHEPVLRHLFTQSAEVDFDDDSGRITVSPSADGQLTLELDMLDPDHWPEPGRLRELKDDVEEFDQHVLHPDHAGQVIKRLVYNLSGEGSYSDDGAAQTPQDRPIGTFAPALIFRRRTQRGLVEIFQTIKQQLEERQSVPAGLRILMDPEQAPTVTEVVDHASGAWVADGNEVYLPLPVNDKQLEVIRRVDTRAMTVVQGPPGTGKTHTAAALISHLLAQGKRVLVTAHTDRALKEVRGKLPESIQDLSVSVVGRGREELAELRVAVRKLSEIATDHSPEGVEARLVEIEDRLRTLREDKARTGHQLLEARESETLELDHEGYRGTLAQIATAHAEQRSTLGWLVDMASPAADDDSPLSDAEAQELVALLRDDALVANEGEAAKKLVEIGVLPAPDAFARVVEQASRARKSAEAFEALRDHEAYERVRVLEADARRELRGRVDALATRADQLSRRNEQWLGPALADVCSGKLQAWQSRDEQITQLTDQARELADRLGPLVQVEVSASDLALLQKHATALRAYLSDGKTIKVDPSTQMPKLGVLSAKVLKDASPLFEHVRVNGLPPTNIKTIAQFWYWAEATKLLDALDRSWPSDVEVPVEDSLAERLAWHVAEHRVLESLLHLGADLVAEERRLEELRIPKPDWRDFGGVRRFAQVVDAADAREEWLAAEEPLTSTLIVLTDAVRQGETAAVVSELRSAIESRDLIGYGAAHDRLRQLWKVRERAERRDELMQRLAASAPAAAEALRGSPSDGAWDERMPRFEDAWSWATTSAWIEERAQVDVNQLQARYCAIEDQIRASVSELATIRAWSHAVERLGPQARADLTQYAQLVQGFGRTGGKYRERKLRDMREAMQRCRPSVPVWILPLYRIAQTLEIDADLFDVVVVDEASQAGLEATFLQYLAPKIVVIGDDKQVSPRAVGIDQAQIQGLSDQLLYDDRYKAAFENPKRSLFDEARMRFGDLITLVEHRRCVPDIIGFSNRIAYEPDDIRLIPVRQVGRDALEPVQPVFVEGGYNAGGINQPEVDAVVEQVEKCAVDERYDGLTFGVVSLTGVSQAKAIEKALMERIDPREWEARDLRCGTAADFQGSERDVMFLSMVASLAPGGRYAPLTADAYVQQFNVASSRAKDQLWVFHSIRQEELANHEDMRYQLLEYSYGVANRRMTRGAGHSVSPVPEDHLVRPFDSIFEQRMHNRIFDRGYQVIPQYQIDPWRIDLVVIGASGMLAVECDGDHWHGPDRYQQDLARQRELERCGWRFFRVRESEFNIDATRALAPLWGLLDELDMRPGGTEEEAPDDVATVGDGERHDVLVSTTLDAAEGSLRGDSLSEAEAGDQASETVETETAGAQATAPMASGPRPEGSGLEFAPYASWHTGTQLADPKQAKQAEVIDALCRIVATEGPVLGDRLYKLYIKSAGRARVGRQYNKVLNAASAAAVREGLLAEGNPLSDAGQRAKTFSMPDGPDVVVRELGPRALDEVPPAELAAVLAALRSPELQEEDWFRAVLDRYGLSRLTTNVRDRLRRCVDLI